MSADGEPVLEIIVCPFCNNRDYAIWDVELGFQAVRCKGCSIIYVNPRPPLSSIDAAVRTGVHGLEAQSLNVMSRRSQNKVARYKGILGRLFDDLWRSGKPVSWLDIGAGYGEVVEAVAGLAPPGSLINGLEPMKHKAQQARARGLAVVEDYLRPDRAKVDIVSLVDVFSHIPDFAAFLTDVKAVLKPGGEIFVETGNLADLTSRDEFPGELGLPDHLVFAGEQHLRGYLERAAFEVVRLDGVRTDGAANLFKNLVKKLLGRPVKMALPYTSDYRQMLVRARLRT